jgi:ADP-heptose:LPS heptosyltransferase
MTSTLDTLPEGARVAVIRLRSLGDCVLTTPALEILKNSRPDLQVAVVVEPSFAPVFEGNPDVSAILGPGMREIVRWRPRLCLNLHGGIRSLRLTLLSSARVRAGFGHFRYAAGYNVRIPTAQEILGVSRKVHTAEHLASAIFHLGAAPCEIPRSKLLADGDAAGLRSRYAVIHPLASAPDKTWPAGRFIEVARRLKLEAVFIGGPGEDLDPFGEFRTVAGAPLAEIKALLSRASLFIGNDSGPAHMAAALRVPTVVVFGNSDPEIWGPWRAEAEAIVAWGPIASVLESEVLDAVERLKVAA